MKKFWLKMGAIAITLLAIIGYQFSDSGKLPNLSNFAQGVTCTSSGNVVTVSAASGEQVVITFANTTQGTTSEPTAILYYEKQPSPSAKVTPLSLLSDLAKYQFIINFARDCVLPHIPSNVDNRK